MAMLHLKGDHLEGGGQLLRIAAGLSALTGVPITINKIRGKRPKSGLKNQHLLAIQWLGRACNAQLSGDKKGSTDLTFEPGLSDSPSLRQDTNSIYVAQDTPGSIGLIFQALLPFILFSPDPSLDEGKKPPPVTLTIEGGTNCSFSPSLDYIAAVMLPTLERIGVPPIKMKLESRGWTHGRAVVGKATFVIQPFGPGQTLQPFELETRGALEYIDIHVIAPNYLRHQIKDSVIFAFEKSLPLTPTVVVTNEDSHHEKRLYLLLVLYSSNGYKIAQDCLWDEKITDPNAAARKLVAVVTKKFMKELDRNGCVDEHLQDQLVVFQALAAGTSTVRPGFSSSPISEVNTFASLHTKTARWIASEMLGADFDECGGCKGIGFVAGKLDREQIKSQLEDRLKALSISKD